MKDEKENEKKVNEGKYTITYQKKKKVFSGTRDNATGCKPTGEDTDGWNTVGLPTPRVFMQTPLHLVWVLCF